MRVTVKEIISVVAQEYGVDVVSMRSAARFRTLADARQAVYWIARKLTTVSLPEIGRYLGGRDHTTVLHGIRKVDSAGLQEAGRRAYDRLLVAAAEPEIYGPPAPIRAVLAEPIDLSEPYPWWESEPEPVAALPVPLPGPVAPPPPAPVMRVIPSPTKRVTVYRKPPERQRVVTGAIFGDPGHASARIARGERSADR